MLTAVVCSGRNRPQDERPVGPDAEGAPFVGGGDEPGTGWEPVSSNGANPSSSTMTRS